MALERLQQRLVGDPREIEVSVQERAPGAAEKIVHLIGPRFVAEGPLVVKILVPAPPLDVRPRLQAPLKRLDVREQHLVVGAGGHGRDRRPPTVLAAAARRLD